MGRLSSCKFGILLARSVSGLLLAVTIVVHMESLLSMMLPKWRASTMSSNG
nr:hypothetical protein Iba_chr04fCG1880 [Ipomoea batatas]